MYQPGGTLRNALTNIEQKKWVLPAIQREFVWRPAQITGLFDSLMQGFPFGTFLFWRIDPEHSSDWKFYDFVRDYHERDSRHCPDLGPVHDRGLTAVLDGQQRLTALNVGLRGSISLRRKHARHSNPNAYPKWRLYLNLLADAASDESAESTNLEKERYDFRFMEEAKPYSADQELWFPVSEILKLEPGPGMLKWLTDKSLAGDELHKAFTTLNRLHQVIHTDQVVYYYEENSPDLERVLNIFIRLNSAGTLLSQSDLLHSIIVAQWSDRDARDEIASLVDQLNRVGAGFNFSQNFVLKAGLMLADVASVGFKVENFTRENMALLEKDWDRIRTALVLTAHLASHFGLSGQNLRAVSSLLPIAYYLYHSEASEAYLTATKFADDRREIGRWLVASLLKTSGIWGSGLDTLLTLLRTLIRERTTPGFPASALRQAMAERGKSLAFDEPQIELLLDLEYQRPNTFLALTLLYPFVDLRNKFHVDHIFPAALLTWPVLRKAEIPDDQISWMISRKNRLANLQLMDGAENNEKRKTLPGDWMELRYPDASERRHYATKYDLGSELPAAISGFREFYELRRGRLRERLQTILNA